VGVGPDHRVVGAVRLPSRAGRQRRRRGRVHGGVLQCGARLPVGLVPATAQSAGTTGLGKSPDPGALQDEHQGGHRRAQGPPPAPAPARIRNQLGYAPQPRLPRRDCRSRAMNTQPAPGGISHFPGRGQARPAPGRRSIRELSELMLALERWGRKWAELKPEHAHPGVVLWVWANFFISRDRLPRRRVLVRFEYPTLPGSARRSWLLIETPGRFRPTDPSRRSRAELCPLPTRIDLSYLTLWAQRSSSQAQLPGGARLAPTGYRQRGRCCHLSIGPTVVMCRGMVKSCGRRVPIDHAATLVPASSGRSMSTPFSNFAPARTRVTRCGPLT
jgi:hypothetical protein